MPDSQRNSKKAEIIKAATTEFILKGYDGARMMEIAERAGVGHPLLHYHFKSKKELFKQVVQSKLDLLQQTISVDCDDSDHKILEKLRITIGRHFDFACENADYLRFQFEELNRHPELFEEIKGSVQPNLAAIKEKLQRELDHAAEAGEIVPTDATTLLENILALNLFFVLSMPMIEQMGEFHCDSQHLENRKKENIQLIINRLTK